MNVENAFRAAGCAALASLIAFALYAGAPAPAEAAAQPGAPSALELTAEPGDA